MTFFVTIGYGDEAGYDRTDKQVRARAHEHDDLLKRRGARLGVAGTPVQVRNHDDLRREVREGPFLRSDLRIAGFGILEAESLDEAIALAAASPCAVAHGVVEVWPVDE